MNSIFAHHPTDPVGPASSRRPVSPVARHCVTLRHPNASPRPARYNVSAIHAITASLAVAHRVGCMGSVPVCWWR